MLIYIIMRNLVLHFFQISKLSEDYLALQQKLNEMILSHQLRPVMLSKDKQTNDQHSSNVCQSGNVEPYSLG